MREISLNLLDIVQNSITAGASHVRIDLFKDRPGQLILTVADDGDGMDAETLKKATDPFFTTRKTRKVGLGLSLLRAEAERTGGSLALNSVWKRENPTHHGTTLTAVFCTDHVDCPPMGNIVETLCALLQGHPNVDITFRHRTEQADVRLDTAELKQALGGDIPLSEYEILCWISEFLHEQYRKNQKNKTGGF